MIHLKKYNNFITESISINLSITIDDLLSSLGEPVDIFKLFEINRDQVNTNGDIKDLFDNSDFGHNLDKKNFKKSNLEDTSDDETLLDSNTSLRFFFILKKDLIQIEEPSYVIVQYISNNKKSDIKGFSNDNNINEFYKKLTDSVIELSNGKDTYVYQTSNGGNDWELRNVQMENSDMVGELGKDELNNLITKLKLKIVK